MHGLLSTGCHGLHLSQRCILAARSAFRDILDAQGHVAGDGVLSSHDLALDVLEALHFELLLLGRSCAVGVKISASSLATAHRRELIGSGGTDHRLRFLTRS